LPKDRITYADNIYWVYGVLLADDFGYDADYVRKYMADKQVGTRPFFWPIHEQPVFKKTGMFERENYPVAEKLARRGFYVPSGLALTELQIEYVVECLKEILK
jgi:perosamine synthetase